jgi:hypothetical protein
MKNNPNLSKLKQTIKEIIKELDDELDEHNMTGNVDGYNTPSAFTKTNGTDVDAETDDEYVKRLNKSTGYVKVNENRYHELRKSEGTPNQKIGVGIRELRKQLSEIEKFVSWYGNIKTENEMGYSDYWKRTQKHLSKISERLSKLSLKVRELSS